MFHSMCVSSADLQSICPLQCFSSIWEPPVFSNSFPWMEVIVIGSNIPRTLIPGKQLVIDQNGNRWMLGAEQVTGHCINKCWYDLLTLIWVTRSARRSEIHGNHCTWYLSLWKKYTILKILFSTGGYPITTDCRVYHGLSSLDLLLTNYVIHGTGIIHEQLCYARIRNHKQ